MKKDLEQLEKEVEALLFYKNEPMTGHELASLCDTSESDIGQVLENLEKNLDQRGIVLVKNGGEYCLATASSVSVIIERAAKEELNRDLSPASLETLAVVCYKGLVSRKEIEYIRGVNSSFSLRALLVRGLIEREGSKLDERIFLYKPSTDLLMHLGVSKIEDLPEWTRIQQDFKETLEQSQKESVHSEDQEPNEN